MSATNVTYMTIPSDDVILYKRLLIMLVDFGVDLVKDCSSSCKATNKKIIDCWNMFQSGIAAYNLAEVKDTTDSYYKKYKTIMKYVDAQISITYQNQSNSNSDEIIVEPIIPDYVPVDLGTTTDLMNIHLTSVPNAGDKIKLTSNNKYYKFVPIAADTEIAYVSSETGESDTVTFAQYLINSNGELVCKWTGDETIYTHSNCVTDDEAFPDAALSDQSVIYILSTTKYSWQEIIS